MRILALDPATLLGYALDEVSGVHDFSLRSNESKGMKFLKFKTFLVKMIKLGNVELVAYEKPIGGHFNATRSSANFEGVILSVCEEQEVLYKDYSPSEIKSFAKQNSSVKGRMNKANMVIAAEEFFDIIIEDDNHADALWLYALTMNEFI